MAYMVSTRQMRFKSYLGADENKKKTVYVWSYLLSFNFDSKSIRKFEQQPLHPSGCYPKLKLLANLSGMWFLSLIYIRYIKHIFKEKAVIISPHLKKKRQINKINKSKLIKQV